MHHKTNRAVQRLCDRDGINPDMVVHVFRVLKGTYLFNTDDTAEIDRYSTYRLHERTAVRYLQPGVYITWSVGEDRYATAGPGSYNSYWSSGPEFSPEDLLRLAKLDWVKLLE